MADDEQVPPPGPKVGHFLPGGAGDQGDAPAAPPGEPRTSLTPSSAVNRQQLGLGKARPVGQAAPPLQETDLRDTRQPGGAQRVGWHSTPTRTGVQQFSAQPPDIKQQRRFSKAIVATLSVLVLIVLGGGVIASYKVIDSFDNTVDNPLSRPSVRPSEEPLPAPPQPTVTVTVPVVPDLVRLRQNKLYTVGKLPSVSCAEPKIKPTTAATVLRYYRALLPCLNTTWEPLVLKAGYSFRQPKLTLVSKNASSCVGKTDLAYYCGADETISMQWEEDVKSFKEDPMTARVQMMSTLAHEYGHHVQMLTNILISSGSREGWAKTSAEKLEWSRRKELQANCLGAAFLGANKQTLGLSGEPLRYWQWMEKHSGDEYNSKKVRDHGSRKNTWAWAGPAFKSANPASCNTYTAPPAKVS